MSVVAYNEFGKQIDLALTQMETFSYIIGDHQ
jgi:hypothetical protein